MLTPIPLAIMAALEDEIRALRSRLSGAERLSMAAGKVTLGTWGRLPLLLVSTGVGPAAAARTLHLVLDKFSPGLCLQIGYAGATVADLQAGDLVIATALIDAARGRSFPVDPELVARAEMIRRRLNLHGGCGPLLTLAQPALSPEEKAAGATAHPALALEMEGAAFAGACRAAGLPYLVVRAILDPLNFQFPESRPPTDGLYPCRRQYPFKSPPLSDLADLARRSLTTFAAAWLDDLETALLTGDL
jgi:adenosylhomocysteine nucleosidase